MNPQEIQEFQAKHKHTPIFLELPVPAIFNVSYTLTKYIHRYESDPLTSGVLETIVESITAQTLAQFPAYAQFLMGIATYGEENHESTDDHDSL